ncbi:ACT domain-containing protein [Lentilactobacillus kosonis]|uniref:UPF0735 ACT domain-containing protein NBRC111893_646 n=1 Tax=Lentilactobacillus kosonis TaxID=2810561 RepID=A0A401FJD0_9LACO|nr:ACT domain-containing protein [Lentilactobacillus kosonis]GAY72500.1 ACT-domain-containing protein, predicted allosteric regulator of homoserine dehydrogenase [Lentilactobacillus kosonis]
MEKYYIVDSSILPTSFEKVVKARKLLETGKVNQISEAVKAVGISRGTYYKYKDLIFLPGEVLSSSKAVISLLLEDQPGNLSNVLTTISNYQVNILTINQNIPIHGVANLVLSLDITNLSSTINDMLNHVKFIDGISNLSLVSVE